MSIMDFDALAMQAAKERQAPDKSDVTPDSIQEQIDNEKARLIKDRQERNTDTRAERSSQSRGGTSQKSETAPKRIRSETTQIRDFPSKLVEIARSEFPGVKNNSEALAAYVYLKSGKKTDVPQRIRELVDGREIVDPMESVDKRLYSLEQHSRLIMDTLYRLEHGLGYMIFDRLGFRRNTPTAPRSIQFDEIGVDDVKQRLREQSKQQKAKEAIKNGRPIK